MKRIGKTGLSILKWVFIVLANLIILIGIFFTFTVQWGVNNFGGLAMEEIVFTLCMPLEGSDPQILSDYIYTAVISGLIYYAFVVLIQVSAMSKRLMSCTYHISCKLKGTNRGIRVKLLPVAGWFLRAFLAIAVVASIAATVYSAYRAENAFQISSYVKSQMEYSTFIEEEYIDPNSVEITFPSEKQNLIWIVVESLETSLQDKKSGGSFSDTYIPELISIAKDNISFSQSSTNIVGAVSLNSTTWTVAGLVAQSSGLPLKISSGNNSMSRYEYFLPGVTSMGDILLENGYSNYFMCGSDSAFGGRDNYFSQHGDYTIYDYYTAIDDGIIEEGYYVWWGMEDMYLFQYAKQVLPEIAASGEPFNFTVLTVDSHRVGGYICELCGNEYGSQYANVWACTSCQVSAFVEWIQEQDFYENTTIVITGDHPSMDTAWFEQATEDDNRYVYNAYINVALEYDESVIVNRSFSTMDFFPTTLAAIGVTIEGDKLGLGTNLFSGIATLVETYGVDYINEELSRVSGFYNNKLLYK